MTHKRFQTIKYGLPAAIAAGAFGLILFPSETTDAAKEGLSLCGSVIIPSLFPFFVLSTLVIQLGWGANLGVAAAPIMGPLFGLGGACASALLLGLVGGYPVGARTAAAIYERGECSKADAERLLAFCSNCGPAFILGAVGAGVFRSAGIGIFLYVVHAVSALITGLLFRRKHNDNSKTPSVPKMDEPKNYSEVFICSIQSAFSSVLNICGFVIFFSVVIRLLSVCGVTGALSKGLSSLLSPSGIDGSVINALIAGAAEMSSGIWALSSCTQNIRAAASAASFILAFGGLSVHTQSLSFISPAGLSSKKYFAGKTIQAIIASLLTYLIFPLLPSASASAYITSIPLSNEAVLASCIRISAFITIFLSAFFLFFVLFFRKKDGKTGRKAL